MDEKKNGTTLREGAGPSGDDKGAAAASGVARDPVGTAADDAHGDAESTKSAAAAAADGAERGRLATTKKDSLFSFFGSSFFHHWNHLGERRSALDSRLVRVASLLALYKTMYFCFMFRCHYTLQHLLFV